MAPRGSSPSMKLRHEEHILIDQVHQLKTPNHSLDTTQHKRRLQLAWCVSTFSKAFHIPLHRLQKIPPKIPKTKTKHWFQVVAASQLLLLACNTSKHHDPANNPANTLLTRLSTGRGTITGVLSGRYLRVAAAWLKRLDRGGSSISISFDISIRS